MSHRNNSVRIASKLIPLAAVLSVWGAGAAHAQGVLFDNISNGENGVAGASLTSTGSTPNTFIGDAYTLAGGAKDITGFDLFPVNLSGTNFTALKISIYVWGTVNTGTVTTTAPAFSNLLGSYTLTTTGTYTSGFYYPFETGRPGTTPAITLATPLAISSPTIGLTFAYQGSTDGVTFASVNSLTSLISYGTGPSQGSDFFNGYYRNANSETNGNFTSSLRTLGVANQSASVRIFGDSSAPEPTAVALALSGAMLTVGGMVRRRRAAKA